MYVFSVLQKVECNNIRVSCVGLAAELFICKQLSSATGLQCTPKLLLELLLGLYVITLILS